MKTFSNWMIAIFMIMFWGLRVAVAYTYGKGIAFIATPINYVAEVVLLFVTLLCIILFVKRIVWGGVIYVISNILYFGADLLNKIVPIIQGEQIGINNGFDIFLSGVAIVLSLVVMIDLASDHTNKPDNKKTDWFFNNKDLDRNFDEKADHNNYKLY